MGFAEDLDKRIDGLHTQMGKQQTTLDAIKAAIVGNIENPASGSILRRLDSLEGSMSSTREDFAAMTSAVDRAVNGLEEERRRFSLKSLEIENIMNQNGKQDKEITELKKSQKRQDSKITVLGILFFVVLCVLVAVVVYLLASQPQSVGQAFDMLLSMTR